MMNIFFMWKEDIRFERNIKKVNAEDEANE